MSYQPTTATGLATSQTRLPPMLESSSDGSSHALSSASVRPPTPRFSQARPLFSQDPSQQTALSIMTGAGVGATGTGLCALIGAVATPLLAASVIGAVAGAAGVIAYKGTVTLLDRGLCYIACNYSLTLGETTTYALIAAWSLRGVFGALVGVGVAVGVIFLLAAALATPVGMALVGAALILIALYIGYGVYQNHRAQALEEQQNQERLCSLFTQPPSDRGDGLDETPGAPSKSSLPNNQATPPLPYPLNLCSSSGSYRLNVTMSMLPPGAPAPGSASDTPVGL